MSDSPRRAAKAGRWRLISPSQRTGTRPVLPVRHPSPECTDLMCRKAGRSAPTCRKAGMDRALSAPGPQRRWSWRRQGQNVRQSRVPRGRNAPVPCAPRPVGAWQQLAASIKPSPGGRGDRGSVSLWVVIFTFTTLALLVLVVDGGQTMNAKSRAADIAEQAARAAADDVSVAGLRGGAVTLGGGACDLKDGPAAQLVADYVSGVPGATATLTACTPSVTTVGGTPSLSVSATVQLSVRPALPVPPFNAISATAQETAYLACGSADQREAC
jgi:hypothetical protein